MNEFHLELLASPMYAHLLEHDLLPWVDSVAELGDAVLEVGPGPGLALCRAIQVAAGGSTCTTV